MVQRRFEAGDAALDLGRGVDRHIVDQPLALVEQAQIMVHSRRRIVHPPEHLFLARHFVAVRRRTRFQQLANFSLERGRQHFVGVEQQHPIVAGGRQRHPLLRPVTAERMLGDPRAVTVADGERVVGAERIQHHDLIGPLDALQAGGQSATVIVGGDKHRKWFIGHDIIYIEPAGFLIVRTRGLGKRLALRRKTKRLRDAF